MELKPWKLDYFEKDTFEAWLQSKQPDDIVGRAGYEVLCPIYNYLRENGQPVSSVDSGRITMENGDAIITPDWAEEFIMEIGEDAGPISAAIALETLSEIDN